MYTVHAVVFKTVNGSTTRHEVLIHDTMSPLHEQHLIDPKLKIADSSAGSFSATLSPYNPGYSLIERFNSIIKIHKGTELIWTGRVLNESVDFWNRRSISCEGALAFLNDTIQPIAYYGTGRSPAYILRTLLDIHNSKTVTDRKLYLGAVSDFTDDEYGSYVFETNNGNTWEELKTNLLERLDGHLVVRYTNEKAYVDYFSDYPNTAVQHINFGDNLLDFTRNWNLTNLTTVILPRGAALDADTAEGQKAFITLKSSTEGSQPIENGNYSIGDNANAITVDGQYLINNALYTQYGRVEKVVDFNDSTNAQDLFNLARNYISSMQFDELTITVSAVDLHLLTKEIVSFNLLDEVYCISVPHGMYGRYFPISEMDIPLDKPENTTYTLSSSRMINTLTGNLSGFKSGVKSSFKNLTSTGHILDMAKTEASSIINRKTTGYVNVINMYGNEEEGVAQAIVISNNPEWKQASKYWIWNMNGLAYYSASRSEEIKNSIETSNAYPYSEIDYASFDTARYYDMAITMDGTIVANHIKAGILSDGMGYNYWNLETGEFSLQPNTKLQFGGTGEYTSVHDLVWSVDKAGRKKSGAENYLDGAKDWAGWEYNEWTFNNEEATNTPGNSSNWLRSKDKSIDYSSIKGYAMTFSMEGCMVDDSDWGDLAAGNSVIVSIGLWRKVNVFGRANRVAYIDRLFSFDSDYTRRFVSVDIVDGNFTMVNNDWSDQDVCVRINISNSSNHKISIRRPQFEHGNTPTDWSTSEADIDREAENKANSAYNASIVVAKTYANEAQTNASAIATRLSSKAFSDAKSLVHSVSEKDKKYSDDILNAFQESLYHEEVLRRLTNNYSDDGLYMKDNHIYMNATAIRSGSLDAALLRAGVIHDGVGNNRWDLTTGYFESNNGFFNNIEATGSLTAGNDYGGSFWISDGTIQGYWNGQYAGRISTMRWENKSSLILAADRLVIDSRDIFWSRGSAGSYTRFADSEIDFNFIREIVSHSDGTITWYYGAFQIEVENGLVSFVNLMEWN